MDAGFSKALNNLACFYEKGLGVPQDYAKAFGLFQSAMDCGDILEITSLGTMYERGDGVAEDFFKAREP